MVTVIDLIPTPMVDLIILIALILNLMVNLMVILIVLMVILVNLMVILPTMVILTVIHIRIVMEEVIQQMAPNIGVEEGVYQGCIAQHHHLLQEVTKTLNSLIPKLGYFTCRVYGQSLAMGHSEIEMGSIG